MPDGAGSKTGMLEIRDLHPFYGESHILHGVCLDVRRGEVVTLLGRNGAGKTTTMRSIMGIVGKLTGSIRLNGTELVGLGSNRIAKLGIGYVPEERGIFSSLTVEENLMLPPTIKPGGMDVEAIYTLFPNLKERRKSQGTRLSGGEQQMLAIGRILRTGADFILLDEPTEGLAPVIIQQIGRTIHRLKNEGYTIILEEGSYHFSRTVADRHYVVEEGHVGDTFTNSELEANMGKL